MVGVNHSGPSPAGRRLLSGLYMMDEAERELMGHENVLVDTTWPPSIREFTAETLTTIIGKHGANKVCSGTDYPLVDTGSESDYLASLPLTSGQVEGILGENARRFIGL